MRQTRSVRALLGVVLAAGLVAAACGDDSDDSDGEASGDQNGASEDGSAASDDGASSEASGETRTFEHDQGTSEIPVDPQKVVVLDTPQLDAAIALGVTPIGAVTTDVSTELPEWIEGTDDIEHVGTIQQPNLEAIAELNPDLILSSSFRHEELYDDLAAIGPTVFVEDVAAGWKDNFLVFADAMGKRDEAETMLEDYEARADDIGEQLGDDETIGIVRFLPDEWRIYGPASFSGSILADDVEVPLPVEVADVTDEIALYPSIEEVDLVEDADVLFVTTYGDPDETTVDEIQGGPIWPTLPAVESGNVHEVSDDIWMLGIGMLGANAILDDIEDQLL